MWEDGVELKPLPFEFNGLEPVFSEKLIAKKYREHQVIVEYLNEHLKTNIYEIIEEDGKEYWEIVIKYPIN